TKTLDLACRSSLRGQGRQLLQSSNQLLIFARARFGKPPNQLRSRQVIDRLNLQSRRLAAILANRDAQPLKSLLIRAIVRQQIAGISQRYGSIPLQLPPNFHTLALPLTGQAKRQQQPWTVGFSCTHFPFSLMLWLY